MTNLTDLPLPPGRGVLGAVTESLAFLRDPKSFSEERIARHGRVFRTHMLGRPTVVVAEADAIRSVFAREHGAFEASWHYTARKLLGEFALATQTGAVHLHRRRLLARPFRPRALDGYLDTVVDVVDRRIDAWLQAGELALGPELQALTFEVAARLFLNAEDEDMVELLSWFDDYVAGLFSVPVALPWTGFGRALRARRELLARLGRVIADRQARDEPGTDALGQLLTARDEAGEALAPDELKDQVLVLMFAGHETTGTALTSLVLQLAQHPDAVERLRGEGLEITDRKSLIQPHRERTIRETLRFIPPVGGGFRVATEDAEVGGFRVPKGWAVLYGIGGAHADEARFEDPGSFCPHRFGPERDESAGYLPFGGGARICLGMELALLEMRVLAARLLARADVTLVEGQDLSINYMPTPRPRGGLQVRLTPR